MTSTTALSLHAPAEDSERYRDQALALYGEAFDALRQAQELAQRAAHTAKGAGFLSDDAERKLRRGDRAAFMEAITRDVDSSVWLHWLNITQLERLMDQKAKATFREQIRENPAPATAANCYATMEQLHADAPQIFRRGIADTFSRLDRRFRSHDGFKIGARIVLSSTFSGGYWNQYAKHDDTLLDVERAFYVLDGRSHPSRPEGIVGAIDAKRDWRGATQFVAETEYFTVRVFKNGNCHLWFKRDDLTERVNLVLADHYGAVLGCGQTDQTAPRSRSPVAGFSFFETPSALSRQVIDEARIHDAGLTVLEPSAGTGRLAFPAADRGAHVVAVEYQPQLVASLRSDGRLGRVVQADFLALTPAAFGRFDRVIMNPPFDGGRDIDHVRHALSFVAPGGRLVAIMAAGIAYKEDARTLKLRTMIEDAGGTIRDLPPGSFAEAGTNVNTCLVTIPVPGAG